MFVQSKKFSLKSRTQKLFCGKYSNVVRVHKSLKLQGQMQAVQSQVQVIDEQSRTLSLQDATQPQEIDQSREQATVINNFDNVTPVSTTSCVTRTRCPKLTLPEFKENVANWTTFWGSFQSAIHNKNITDEDKFNYLYSVLEGSAAGISRVWPLQKPITKQQLRFSPRDLESLNS